MVCYNGKRIISNLERADNTFKRTLGLMLRTHIKDDYGLLFSFVEQTTCDIHMLFVPFDIDIIFLDYNCKVIDLRTLKAWTGRYKVNCCSFIECKKGTIEKNGIKIGGLVSF